MKLLGRTESNIIKNKNGENVPQLEITEIVLVHCDVVSNCYQRESSFFYIFGPNEYFDQLLDISPSNFIFSETFN